MDNDGSRVRLDARTDEAGKTSLRDGGALAEDDARVLLDECYTALHVAVANGGELDGPAAERLMGRIMRSMRRTPVQLAIDLEAGSVSHAVSSVDSERAALLDVVHSVRMALEGEPGDRVPRARRVVEAHRPAG